MVTNFNLLPLPSVFGVSDFVVGVDLPEYGSKNFRLSQLRPPKPIFSKLSVPSTTKNEGGSDCCVFGTTVPSTISPTLYEKFLIPTTPPTVTCVENGFVKIYFAITFFFSTYFYKYTTNFFTFYSFEKTEKAWEKSFNL
jgi:hypothetical protein